MKREIRIGELVISLAGHDKGDRFLVTGKEGGYLLLCDGKRRKAKNCKRKKEKHLFGTGVVCPWVENQPERINNTSVKTALKQLRDQAEEVK